MAHQVDFDDVRRLIVTEIRLKAKIRILENHFTSTLGMIIDGLLPDTVHRELVNIQNHIRTLRECLRFLQNRIRTELGDLGFQFRTEFN